MADMISDVAEMQKLADRLRDEGKRIGVVPTMGFLHQGHLSLIKTAKTYADFVVTTIFVKPTQFRPTEDFSRYPRDIERDTKLALEAGTDLIFAPEIQAIYPPDFRTYVDVHEITDVLEGKSRPGHFRGVATVVGKLFNITKPHVAAFGQKDAQQVAVIRQMIRDLNFDIELIVCPIVREPDGLAMSSRNTYLTKEQRSQATVLYRSLHLAEDLIKSGERNSAVVIGKMREMITKNSSGVVDYLSVADAMTLNDLDRCSGSLLISLAVRFGATRLIDNTTIEV